MYNCVPFIVGEAGCKIQIGGISPDQQTGMLVHNRHVHNFVACYDIISASDFVGNDKLILKYH